MAKLPEITDPTLQEADRVLETMENASKPRPYLGMSSIGEECERKLWFRFRWVARETFTAIVHKKFIDGHRTEDLVIERIRRVPGIELYAVDPDTGYQFSLSDHGGHFKGHMDFVVHGLIQAPKTWHVGEVKATDETSKLDNAKVKFGEKAALQQWHPVYHAQAQCYMGYTGMERHWLVAATPGGRHWTSVRTDFDPSFFLRIKAKAERIIFAAEPLTGISDKADYYQCRWCAFSDQCHAGKLADRNCRTCLHATPEPSGGWTCARFGRAIDESEQRQGCPAHKFIPALVPGTQIDAAPDAAWVEYRMADGSTWRDGE